MRDGIVGGDVLRADNAAHAQFPQFAVDPDFLFSHHDKIAVGQDLSDGPGQTQDNGFVAGDLAGCAGITAAGRIQAVRAGDRTDDLALDAEQVGNAELFVSGPVGRCSVVEGCIVGNVHDDRDQIPDLGGALILEEGLAAGSPQAGCLVGRGLKSGHRHADRPIRGCQRRIGDGCHAGGAPDFGHLSERIAG